MTKSTHHTRSKKITPNSISDGIFLDHTKVSKLKHSCRMFIQSIKTKKHEKLSLLRNDILDLVVYQGDVMVDLRLREVKQE